MEEFKIPPISTLVGSTILNYFRILNKGKVAPGYYYKIFLTTLIVLIATPFHLWEEIYFRKKLRKFKFRKPPLFILGHWRSGTTLLHNSVSKDPSAGYISTYQSLFPNNLASKWLFRTFMKINMPHNRPADGVELNISFPQEDEFAFCNCQPNTYYNFFYFPTLYKTFFRQAVNHENLTEKEINVWYKTYDKLLKKALINSKGERLIVKNPVNTGRIDKILKLYPDARFLYIYRNPVAVFNSTRLFFRKLNPTLWFQEVDDQFIDNMIFDVYKQLIDNYSAQKNMIPAGNIMEIRFEEFEQNPLKVMENIYTNLLKEDFSKVKNNFSEYFSTQKNHKKNKCVVDENTIASIRKNLGKYMKMYNYDLPADMEIRASEKA